MLQQSDEWFQQRLGKATASRFSDVLAMLRSGGEAANRKNYRAQLVIERLTGEVQETYQNGAMQWGSQTEPLAKLAYQLATNVSVEEVGFIKHEELEAGASPDGFIGDNGLVEIKCPNTATFIDYLKAGIVPKEYIPQIQGQLWITGREWCEFVAYDPRMPEGIQLFIKRMERNEDYIKVLEQKVREFLAEVDAEVEFLQNYKGGN